MTSFQHPLIRYHGGKFRIADWIISHFPKHRTYVEPFGGGGSVLLCKQPSQIEVYNDLDSEVVNLFRVLRNPDQRQQLEQQLYFTPFSRTEFYEAYADTDCPIEKARRMIVRAQMGFGSAGATKCSTGFRMAGGKKNGTEVTLWNNYPHRLAAYAERLRSVIIENQDAHQVIDRFDADDTLFFIDPPYVTDTRTSNCKAYRHEMTDLDHIQLLERVVNIKGAVIISGYDHDIYNSRLSHWKKVTRQAQASGQLGGVLRQECLWINPQASFKSDLFGGGL